MDENNILTIKGLSYNSIINLKDTRWCMFISKFKIDDDDFYQVMHDGGDEMMGMEDGDFDRSKKKGKS